jgi:protein-tyrosine phosphatase
MAVLSVMLSVLRLSVTSKQESAIFRFMDDSTIEIHVYFKNIQMPVRVIFICYENICRSPMAEGIFIEQLTRYNLQHFFSVSSAGTVNYQQGSLPDERAVQVLLPLGIDISSVRARSIHDLDLRDYDWIFVMDHENYEEISSFFPAHERPRLHRVLEFVDDRFDDEVSDPYYGSLKEFEKVAEDLVTASEQILSRMFEHYPYLAQHVTHA